jgi:hypothetical protein
MNNNINLGGFPPIYFISTENKKKLEFKKKAVKSVNINEIDKLNILSIKDILTVPTKK